MVIILSFPMFCINRNSNSRLEELDTRVESEWLQLFFSGSLLNICACSHSSCPVLEASLVVPVSSFVDREFFVPSA